MLYLCLFPLVAWKLGPCIWCFHRHACSSEMPPETNLDHRSNSASTCSAIYSVHVVGVIMNDCVFTREHFVPDVHVKWSYS